mgnify:CR=1 FL=1
MRQEPKQKAPRGRRPATTPEGRESQLSSLAHALAEKQLRNGTASAQVVVHFLKNATVREELERERLRGENLMIAAKIEAMESSKKVEELYRNALDAMREYQGQEPINFDD